MKNILVVTLAVLLMFDVAIRVAIPAFAQTMAAPVILGVQSSVSGCAWPGSTYATVSNGMALCPINDGTTLSLALAVNGGTFTLMGTAGPVGPAGPQGPIGPQGIAGPQGVPGVIVGNTLTGNLVCPRGVGSVSAGFTSKGCTFNITAIK